MLKQLLKQSIRISKYSRNLCLLKVDETLPVNRDTLPSTTTDCRERIPSVLDPLTEDISHVSTYLKPTFNFAAYANKSETIEALVNLGVNLHKIENQNEEAVLFLLQRNFDDIKQHIIFINGLGLNNDEIGAIITKNPFIFKENLDDLDVRINYMKFKRFSDEMITQIIRKNPFWLTHSTQDIDKKLGFFQKTFHLSGNEVRHLACMRSKLITYDQHRIKVNIFALKEEMGFKNDELKTILLKCPRVFSSGQKKMLETFEYLHKTMNILTDIILETPQILLSRRKQLQERHEFLVKLNRNQYDPRKPNYIGLMTLIGNTDAYFATEIAKSSIETYNNFLKSL